MCTNLHKRVHGQIHTSHKFKETSLFGSPSRVCCSHGFPPVFLCNPKHSDARGRGRRGVGGKWRICQSMSDPPNPQVRQELYHRRLSQARQSKKKNTHTHTRTSDPRQQLTSSLQSELILCVIGEDDGEGIGASYFGPSPGFLWSIN